MGNFNQLFNSIIQQTLNDFSAVRIPHWWLHRHKRSLILLLLNVTLIEKQISSGCPGLQKKEECKILAGKTVCHVCTPMQHLVAEPSWSALSHGYCRTSAECIWHGIVNIKQIFGQVIVCPPDCCWGQIRLSTGINIFLCVVSLMWNQSRKMHCSRLSALAGAKHWKLLKVWKLDHAKNKESPDWKGKKVKSSDWVW